MSCFLFILFGIVMLRGCPRKRAASSVTGKLRYRGTNMKPFAKAFYKSIAWKKCRDAFYKSKYGLCERCGNGGLIVHHKIKLTPQNINDPIVALNWDSLELLCLDCHNRKYCTNDGIVFDENGDLIKITPP